MILYKKKYNTGGILKYNTGGILKYQTGGKIVTTILDSKEEPEFKEWYSKVNPDSADQYYDYRGYWKNEDSNKILTEDKEAHFIDRYKQPGHPTFSTESKYSTDNTEGGSWSQDKNNKWYFTHSPYTSEYARKTYDYLRGSGETSILNGDTLRYNKPLIKK